MILTVDQRKYIRWRLREMTESLDEALQEFPQASISVVRRVSNDAHYRHVTAWMTYDGAREERNTFLVAGDDPELYVLQSSFDRLIQERLYDQRQEHYLSKPDVVLAKTAASLEIFTGALEVLKHSHLA